MTLVLSTYEPKIIATEEQYYAKLDVSPVVKDAIDLRNEGLRCLRSGFGEEAVNYLGDSVSLLGAYGVKSDEFAPFIKGFDRELYASLVAKAQALCASGKFDEAIRLAELAEARTPKPLLKGERVGEDIPDQYEISYSGRLALILSTASWNSYTRQSAPRVFRRAREIAPISQDPLSVVFTDDRLSHEERKQSAKKATWFANVGSVIARTPSRGVRDFVSELMCAK
jgi:hypothetical protein